MEGETKQPTNNDTHNSVNDKLRKQTKDRNLESFPEVNVRPHVMQHTKIFKVNMLSNGVNEITVTFYSN